MIKRIRVVILSILMIMEAGLKLLCVKVCPKEYREELLPLLYVKKEKK
jgi:hypothetical protein